MVTAVGFDLDGTLFDDRQYVRAGLKAAARALESRTGVDAREDLLKAYFRRDIREGTFDHVLDARDLSPDLVPELVAAYHDHDDDLVAYPETVPVLESLDDYRLGLLTGGTNGGEKLERLAIASYFDAVVVTADGDATKRDPEPFRELCDALDVEPSEMAYVGDRPELDFARPNDLGMYTVRVMKGQYADVAPESDPEEPDATIDSLAALPGLLRRRASPE
ncbi:HAD family hydrolase [Halorussus litoreus]|uniref:HAD family hydrolase n=1 Tax=Halorussus litoreus TaxID=1710536 RepID=UPI0013004495|nr:HAD-IA family hydrolase [Halorussus litoreus]